LLQDGLGLTPGHAGLATLLGRMLAERGEWQSALEALNTAAIASPSAEDHALRAAVLQHLDRHTEAAEHFTAALRSTPGNSVWWMGLGISLAAQGHADSARQAFNRARSGGNLSPEVAAYVEQRLQHLQ
jgi:MSHA biogenesis protein MshN